MGKTLIIGIIIATYNRLNLLNKLFHQINKLNIPINVKLKIILVEDGNLDYTKEGMELDSNLITKIKGNGNWWWTKCMNEGFKKAIEFGYEFVLILNDDIEIQPNYLKTLLDDYSTLPPNSILGSSSISINKPHQIESAGTKQFIKWRLKFVPYFKGFKPINENFRGIHKSWTLSGRGTLIPVSIFNQIGFYDEKLVQYGSDDEFCIRANLNKIPVYISWNAHIYNNTNLTSKGSVFKKEGLLNLLKSFFNKYSVNSLYKHAYLYNKYGYKLLLPLHLLIVITGTIKAYYFNYRK